METQVGWVGGKPRRLRFVGGWEATATLVWRAGTRRESKVTLRFVGQDPGGKSSSATVTISVEDVDNRQPKFSTMFYSTSVGDPAAPGPLAADVSAADPDTGGPLLYTLVDPAQQGWLQYFSVTSADDNVTVSLTKDITDRLQSAETSVTLLIQADESNGPFSCNAAIVISLPALPVTTTTPMPTTTTTPMPTTSTTPMPTSTEPPSSTTATSTPTQSSTPVTSPETTTSVTSPGTASSTPVTSPGTSSSTPVTSPKTPPSTPVTSPGTASSTPVTSPGTASTPVTSPGTASSTPVTSPETPTTVTSPGTSRTPVTSPETTTPMTSPGTSRTPVTSPETTTPMTSPRTSPSTSLTSTTPEPTPTPCLHLLFQQREIYGNTSERDIGLLVTVEADPAVGNVSYHILTPGHGNAFLLDSETGELYKIARHQHGIVNLLVQGVFSGNSLKNRTDRTDVVDWDETLLVVDIADENDCRPELSTTAQTDPGTRLPVIGYRASDPAAYPQFLTNVVATDNDTGVHGVDGIVYSSGLDIVHVDADGAVWLVKRPSDAASTFYIEARDNGGVMPYYSATLSVSLVPVAESQLFYISSETQLTDGTSVTALLEDVRQTGGYAAVYACELPQTVGPSRAVSAAAPGLAQSQLLIYAIENAAEKPHQTDLRAVNDDSMINTISKLSSTHHVSYVGTQEERCPPAPAASSNTALIAVVAVLAVLLAIVFIAAAVMHVRVRKQHRRQPHDMETPTGDRGNLDLHQPPSYTPLHSGTAAGGGDLTDSGRGMETDYESHCSATYDNPGYDANLEEKKIGRYDFTGPSIQNHFAASSAPEMEQMSPPSSLPPVADTRLPHTAGYTPVGEHHPTPRPITQSCPPSPPISTSVPAINPVSASDTPAEPIDAPVPPAEPISAPYEPTPDYATKSVGFDETVVCVPAEVVAEEEEEEELEELVEKFSSGESVEVAPPDTTADGGTSGAATTGGSQIYPSLEGMEKPEGDEDMVHL